MEKLPSELVVSVMKTSHQLSDVMALASTCKRFHGVLKKQLGILDVMARPHIKDFDDALAVVRATKIVKDAYKRGHLPPKPFPVHTLTRQYARAQFEEYEKIIDLIDLMCWVEAQNFDTWRKADRFIEPLNPNMNAKRATWQKSFNSSMLKALLAGAVLARDFAEPFYRAANDRTSGTAARSVLNKLQEGRFFDKPGQRFVDDCRLFRGGLTHADTLTEDEAAYLERFAVFDVNPSEDSQEATFGPVADLLFGTERVNLRELGPPGFRQKPLAWQMYDHQDDPDPEWVAVLRGWNTTISVGRVTFGFIHLLNVIPKAFNSYQSRGYCQWRVKRGITPMRESKRAVELVLLGNFNVQSVTCAATRTLPTGVLIHPHSTIEVAASPLDVRTHGYVTQLLDFLQLKMGRPNLTNGKPTTPAALQLFTYTMRSRLRMQLSFDINTQIQIRSWEYYLADPNVFNDNYSTQPRPNYDYTTWPNLYKGYVPPKTRGYTSRWPLNGVAGRWP